MSPMLLSFSISSARPTLSRYSSSTAASRRRIAAGESSGRSTQLRSIRPPIGVFVLSSTQSRLPRFSPVRRFSVSSRLRRAAASSSIYRPRVKMSGTRSCDISPRCASARYASRAPSASVVISSVSGAFSPYCAAMALRAFSASNRPPDGSTRQPSRFSSVSRMSRLSMASGESTHSLGRKRESSFWICVAASFSNAAAHTSPVDTSAKAQPPAPPRSITAPR